MNQNQLSISRWMAIAAIFFSGLATCIAYFKWEIFDFAIYPIILLSVFIWFCSVVWFLWGWLKNANLSGNERQGISSSSYILAFLPICYIFLMVTDESRTRVSVEITNGDKEITDVRIFGEGSIFLNQDTLQLDTLGEKAHLVYHAKAATAPGMRGNIILECNLGPKAIRKIIAGPFTNTPSNIQTSWHITLDDSFLKN